tara:strand:- start:1124 stop:2128 length:1005 start_codon:yes stop_codon:yes gene_type:complete
MTHLIVPTLQDIEAAAQRLSGVAHITPLLEPVPLAQAFGRRVFVKAENLQRVGAFKFRGAYNRLCQLSDAEKTRGVVAFSSGNHAQGVAAAAQILGIEATIVMPSDAPVMKRDNTIAYGARVVSYDRESENREEIAAGIAAKSGAVVVPAYEDFDVMSGQGTAALEAILTAKEQGLIFEQFVCPVGGGGLMSGCATAFKGLSPETKLHGVEPEEFDDVRRSLLSGVIQGNTKVAGSVCDALLSPAPGPTTFAVMQNCLDSVQTITDEQALYAVRYAWEKLKLVVEPGGAVALAALLFGKIEAADGPICLLLSGGNVDAETFHQALTVAPAGALA